MGIRVWMRSTASQNPHPIAEYARRLGHPCDFMDIEGWRKKIDELDEKLVELISERARAAVAIGKLKRDTSMPIYEPDRERIVFENVQAANRGPLAGRDLVRIYERIIDVMRNVQKEEIVPRGEAVEAETELDSEVND
jgi:chorismate mutase